MRGLKKAENWIKKQTQQSSSTNGGGNQGHRCGADCGQVEGEVVGIALVHHFHAEAGTVEDVGPGVDHPALVVEDRLVEVEAIQVEGHRANAEGSEPDAHHGPARQEEVEAAAVVEAGVLEDQATKVTVGSHDVVGLFFLAKLIAVVLRLALGGFTHQGGGHQGAVHGGEEAATEYTSNSQHVEGVHQDVVLSLEHQHVVEGAADAQGHRIGEGTLAEGVNQKHCGSSSHWGAVSNADPGAHAEAVREFPLTAHIGKDADQEVENHQLERTTVVQPLVEAGGFPDGVKVQADGVAGGHNGAGNDVVSVKQAAGNGLTDAVDINGGSGDEGNDETGGGRQQGGDHQDTEPAHIEAVVGAGDPLTELGPHRSALALLDSGLHESEKESGKMTGIRPRDRNGTLRSVWIL